MPVVKIKELPSKQYSEIKETDLMVIEDTSDTKQITIEALRLFFSSDNKLQAMNNRIEEIYNELKNSIESAIKDIDQDNEDLESRLTNLFEDHERTKQQVGKIREELTDAQNNIIDINKHLDTHDTQIKNLQDITTEHEKEITKLQKESADYEKRISALEKDNDINKQDIADIKQDILDFKSEMADEIKRLDDRITQINSENREYTDTAYDNLMKYIDYYHHVHEYPPNFDEPYKGDPMVARYIHPVGTIYETNDPAFEPQKWFPGTWKYMGCGASIDEDGNRTVDYYTYIRIE